MKEKVSVIICTYNRGGILNLCLNSFIEYAQDYKSSIEIILVDNNSNDNTKEVFDNFNKNQIFNAKYIVEKQIGLSYARNTGAEKSSYDWLFYLDDDAFLLENTFNELFITISTNKFRVFGGICNPFYLHKKPNWLDKDFGEIKTSLTKIDTLPDNEKIPGLIMVLLKDLVISSGGFKSELGMKGKDIGYGEETELIIRLKNAGEELGLNPLFKVNHLVGEHKFSLIWHIKAYYVLAKHKVYYNEPTNINFIRSVFLLPIRISKYLIKFLFIKDFCFRKFIWFSFSSFVYSIGHLMGYIRYKILNVR
jgi:glucosyl-dolichyl phosphate glucuronosyltransferase